tara:strand:+ start:131 stop:997 length:867 start_codon:yes stop_codon:yes gene_type:complete
MAAGSGSRYGKLKQFDKLGPGGEFLMEFSIYDAIKFGFDHIVLITKKENKNFLYKYLKEKIPSAIRLDVVVQETSNLPNGINANMNREKPWGTAHAVWCAKEYINDSFAIINADDYYGSYAFKNASKFFDKSNGQNIYGLVTYKLKNTLSKFGSVSRGVCKISNGKLLSIDEYLKIKKSNKLIKDFESGNILSEEDYVSMNFWLCKANFFQFLENYIQNEMQNLVDIEKSEIYLPFAIQKMLTKKIISVDIINSDSDWFGVTYKEDKLNSMNKLKLYIDEGTYPSPLW